MLIINPFIVLVDPDSDEPMKAEYIEDADKRAAVKTLQAAWAAAPAGEKMGLEVNLAAAIEEAKPNLTVGRAIIDAIKTVMKGDDEMSGDTKMELDELAWRIRRVVRHGAVGDTVSFKPAEVTLLKARVNRKYPQVMIVSQIFSAFGAGENNF